MPAVCVRRLFFSALLGAVLSASPVAAQSPEPLLVDAAWLAQHLDDRSLVLLHVGSPSDYDAAHLPGARQVTEETLAQPVDMSKMATALMLELPPIDELRRRVAALGISDGSRIVVYAGSGTMLPSATRIVFTLDYLGLGERTSLLNGGLTAWQKAGRPTTKEKPVVAPGTLAVRPPRPVVADGEQVKSFARQPGTQLVDARGAVFYRGMEATMGEKGHIPGAISIPFTEITDDQQMIDRDRIGKLFAAAGIKPGATVIAYCHVGQQATAVVFAARLLGHRALLYDGSFQDWSINVHGPVEK